MKRLLISESLKHTKKQRTCENDMVLNLDKWEILDKEVDDDKWISASKTKNYLLNDPLLDWLEQYYLKYGYGEDINKSNNNKREKHKEKIYNAIKNEKKMLENTILKKGNEFEKIIYDEIEKKLGSENCIDVITDYRECNITKMNDTKTYMEQGIPIIRQAVLYNQSNKTYGIADLLIRSDYINKLFDDNIVHISRQDETTGCKFSNNYHYRVIDIKWSQMKLCVDGYKILNIDRYPSYKGQIAIYNLALGKIQNFIPPVGYILGKSYKYGCRTDTFIGKNAFGRLGHIQYETYDNKYIEQTKKAIDWYRDMYNNGSRWNIITDPRQELYPNMCNTNDAPYTILKQDIAKKKSEITSLWNVGINSRIHAFTQGIHTWKDDNCNSKTLKIGKGNSFIIDKLIEINKSKTELYYPKKIQSNLFNWRNEAEYLDCYVDFETINSVFYDEDISVENKKSINYIFMIGIGYYNFNNEWIFKEFYMDELNNECEIEMMNDFINYITKIKNHTMQIKNISNLKLRFFHWSQAETLFLENFNNKNNNTISGFLSNIEFADLYKLFITEPICINGSLTYKLKDISKSLSQHGFIESKWNNTDISNGLNAMLNGCSYYKNKDKEILDKIKLYNEIDCKVMGEITTWMRKFL